MFSGKPNVNLRSVHTALGGSDCVEGMRVIILVYPFSEDDQASFNTIKRRDVGKQRPILETCSP